jgi:hypothetical protein
VAADVYVFNPDYLKEENTPYNVKSENPADSTTIGIIRTPLPTCPRTPTV